MYLFISVYIYIYIKNEPYPYRDISPPPCLQCPRPKKNTYTYTYPSNNILFRHTSCASTRLNNSIVIVLMHLWKSKTPRQSVDWNMNQLMFSDGKDRPAKFAMVSPCFKSLNGCMPLPSDIIYWPLTCKHNSSKTARCLLGGDKLREGVNMLSIKENGNSSQGSNLHQTED